MQYRSTHPSGFALGICASILHTNLGSWLITVSGSSKIQTLLSSNVVKIVPQDLKFCNSVEKYQILSGGNVLILLEPLTITITYRPLSTN